MFLFFFFRLLICSPRKRHHKPNQRHARNKNLRRTQRRNPIRLLLRKWKMKIVLKTYQHTIMPRLPDLPTELKKKVCTLIPYLTSLTSYVFQRGRVKQSNPIYLFYEVVHQNASGQPEPGKPGDKHYRCCHGNHKILTVTKLMKSNLNGLDSDSFFSIKLYDLLIFNRAYWSLEAFPHHV